MWTPDSSPMSNSLLTSHFQSAPSSTLKDRMKKTGPRETSRAYDINNIVIPYSMASSTRVEKLQYKEIITPRLECVVCNPVSNIRKPSFLSGVDSAI